MSVKFQTKYLLIISVKMIDYLYFLLFWSYSILVSWPSPAAVLIIIIRDCEDSETTISVLSSLACHHEQKVWWGGRGDRVAALVSTAF